MNLHYQCMTDITDVRNYIANHTAVAFDFKTAPKALYRNDEHAVWDSVKAQIVGCSFSIGEGDGIYVPIAHRVGTNIHKEDFFEFLKEFLTDEKIIKISHDIAFESSMAYALGIVIRPQVYDTICAAQMTLKRPFQFRKLKDNECDLKTLAEELCDETFPLCPAILNGKYFDELNGNDEETVRFGAADADFAFRLYHKFNDWFDKYLPKHRKIVEKTESPTAVYIGIMRHNGIPMDISLMQRRKKETEAEIERIRQEIRFFIGDIDIGANCATQAFKHYLFADLGLPILKMTEKNLPALDDAAIILLKEWCSENRSELVSLFDLVQAYRKYHKVKSTYIDGYMEYINAVTGRIHPNFFGLCTDTGRMNCCHPNLQNMPRSSHDAIGVRNFIRAPENHLILSLDFSQIELRVGAFYCRDERLLDTYRKNEDIHAATTSVIFNISYEEAKDKNAEHYKERRTIAKNVNFGTFYGLYPKGLQATLKFKAGIDRHISQCEQMILNLKTGYKKISIWQEKAKAEAKKRQYSETWMGRRRYLPDIKSGDWSKRAGAERCALNTPIQGTAADILKSAMVRILEGLPERCWLKPILQVHDELTFVIPEDKLDEAVMFIRGCMEEKPFPEFDLDLVAEASYGPTFGDMKEAENEK